MLMCNKECGKLPHGMEYQIKAEKDILSINNTNNKNNIWNPKSMDSWMASEGGSKRKMQLC